MMQNFSKRNFLFLLISIFTIFSCSDRKSIVGHGRYVLYILGKDSKEYLIETDRLDRDTLTPEHHGVDLDIQEMDRDVIVKDGFFYHLYRKKGLFCKYQIKQGKLERLNTLPLPGFSIENFNWLGKDTLLITGLNNPGYNQLKYFILDAKQFTILKSGDLPIPKPAGKFKSLSLGFVTHKDNALFLGYTYSFPISLYDYTTSDTMYVSKLSYPQLQLLKTDHDKRSTYPGGLNTVQSYAFTSENGDYYFMSCPGIALGNRPDLSTGIFRIKAKTDIIDKSYFFNISDSKIDNHAYGIWYLGNGEAIIRSERKDLFTGLDDHYSVAHFEFYLLNLKSRFIRKLKLPLDKGTRRECVLVEGGKAYISVNSTKEGNFIWIYDIKMGTLKKGLQLAGNTDFILRMDRLR